MRPIFVLALAAVGTAALLSFDGCSRFRDPAPTISHAVGGVESIELRHSGFGTTRRQPGHFSLGYAIWANYPLLVYRDEMYRRAGVGSVFITPAHGISPRYVVEETALEPERAFGSPLSRLVITDHVSGQVMGQRILREGQSENGHGWTGQHAAEFVRDVLQTDAPIGGPVGVKSYGEAAATVELLDDGAVQAVEEREPDCPVSYRLDEGRTPVGLDTGSWVFQSQGNIHSYACRGNYILTQSGYGHWLFLDLLTRDGRHLFQTDLRTPGNQDARIALRRLRLRDTVSGSTEMQVDVLYRVFVDRHKVSVPAQHFRATIQLPRRVSRAPPTD